MGPANQDLCRCLGPARRVQGAPAGCPGLAFGHRHRRRFRDGKDLDQLKLPFSILLAVFFLRALVAWAQELAANRCSAQVKSMLRDALGFGAPLFSGSMARSPGALVTWPLWLSAASTPWMPTTGGTYLRSSWPRWSP